VNQPVSANELLTNSSVHGKNFHDMRARSYRVERISTASTWLWLMLETMPFDRGGRCERHQNISNQTMPRRPVASPSRGADAADGAEMLPGFDAWTPPRSDTSPNRRATTPAQSPMSEFLQEEANDNDSDIRGMAQSFWTRRYLNPRTESRFLEFSHTNPMGRLVLCFGYTALRLALVGLEFFSDLSMRSTQLISALCVCAMLLCDFLIVFTLDPVVRRLPAAIGHRLTPELRSFISEWVVALFAVIIRFIETSHYRLQRAVITESGDVVPVTKLSDYRGAYIWYVCFAPPRFFTFVPCFVALVAFELSMDFGVKKASGFADICGLVLVLLELTLAGAMLFILEISRRENFDARTALAKQAHRGAALVAALNHQLRSCCSFALTFPIRPNDYSASDRSTTVTVEETAIITIRLMLPLESGTSAELSAKSSLIEIAESVLTRLNDLKRTTLVRFGSSGTLCCFALVPHARIPAHAVDSNAARTNDDGMISAATLACAFCRMVRRILSSALEREMTLHIGVGIGPVTLVVPQAGAFTTDVTVVGGPVRASLALCEKAMPNSILVGADVQIAAVDHYTMTSLPLITWDGSRQSTRPFLLGLPHSAFSTELESQDVILALLHGLTPEEHSISVSQDSGLVDIGHHQRHDGSEGHRASLPRNDGSSLRGGGDGADAGGEQHRTTRRRQSNVLVAPLSPLAAFQAQNAAEFDDLVESDRETIDFRWSWFSGWYFVDRDVEYEFRQREVKGTARLFPLFVGAFVLFFCLGWLLAKGTEPMTAPAWVSWSVAALVVGTMVPLSRPHGLNQHRLLALSLLLDVCLPYLLLLTLYFHADATNPIDVYFNAPLYYLDSAAVLWIPSCLPVVMYNFVHSFSYYVLGWIHHDQAYFGHYKYMSAASAVTAFVVVQMFRARNRWLHAEVTAARWSSERWAAARARLQLAFSCVVPSSVAKRIVHEGTKSMIHHRLHHHHGDQISSDTKWLSTHLKRSSALVWLCR
jgi:hypothetical protein